MIHISKGANVALSDEELGKVSGGKLYLDGVYLISDDPQFAGKKYKIKDAEAEVLVSMSVKRDPQDETLDTATDAELIKFFLSQGMVSEEM